MNNYIRLYNHVRLPRFYDDHFNDHFDTTQTEILGKSPSVTSPNQGFLARHVYGKARLLTFTSNCSIVLTAVTRDSSLSSPPPPLMLSQSLPFLRDFYLTLIRLAPNTRERENTFPISPR